jgi:hypothetical protein
MDGNKKGLSFFLELLEFLGFKCFIKAFESDDVVSRILLLTLIVAIKKKYNIITLILISKQKKSKLN